uniref:Uncharacterized protein n=1 Tax=Arundo donax TaxID=35708 RepID=A0A0A9BES1_ARUDO
MVQGSLLGLLLLPAAIAAWAFIHYNKGHILDAIRL